MSKTVVVDPVTRIEGHAKILLEINDGGEVTGAHLKVLEIRGFEKFLEGMELFKMPQVTARICGVCPAAHHLASVTAIENGLGVTVPEEARRLRELLYAGHVLHSHALSSFVLVGPDILVGLDGAAADRNIFGLLRLEAELAKKALRLRTLGQRTVEIVGGRGVHPVTAVPGGMAARPDQEKLDLIAAWGAEAQEILAGLVDAVRPKLASLEEFRQSNLLSAHSLAMSDNGTLSYLRGECVLADTGGGVVRKFPAADYASVLSESVMPGSYMKSVRLRDPESALFMVGPLARLNINGATGTPKADAMLTDFRGGGSPRLSVLDFVEARLVEMVHCAEKMAALPAAITGSGSIRTAASPKAGRYVGMVESPRGILIHDYTTGEEGRLQTANLIVATQNNYDAIDTALTQAARLYLPRQSDDLLMNGLEFSLRCFDPCLSCATHASGRMPMDVVIQRGGTVERILSRREE
jgi:F420-non-reducing hydrogenase large subunit